MNLLAEIRLRFQDVLAELTGDDPAPLLDMIRPAQDPKFGDYQANCAMPLKKKLGGQPREIAAQIVERVALDELCEPPEIAGPGFINLRLKDSWLLARLSESIDDGRLGVAAVASPQKIIIDYSAPNVAKPMHVGHIRSTVIGAALYRTLSFLGHQVISDNHIGDWGTQFGMVLYGYKNFADAEAYKADPVAELSRLYRQVNQLVEFHTLRDEKLPELARSMVATQQEIERLESVGETGDKAADKKTAKLRKQVNGRLRSLQEEQKAAQQRVDAVESDAALVGLAEQHRNIRRDATDETARLHEGDEENRRLWDEFLPHCLKDIEKIYRRLDVSFDKTLGESFYHDQLDDVVKQLETQGLARPSDGAVCVFLEDFDAPMIIRKSDGAFLYATTDLATIAYRMKTWSPDVVLYVVDKRQHEHFAKLFAAARQWGHTDVDLRHISFGTVMGHDNRPFKTRSGDVVALDDLLDEAVARAYQVVCRVDDDKRDGPELSEEDRQRVSKIVGYGAVKYSDLSHNRTSDYVFDYDKMLELEGDTATYAQYSYARVQGVFTKAGIDDPDKLRGPLKLEHPNERSLALELLRFGDALLDVSADYRPNLLTAYLHGLATQFSKFYAQCPVLKAEHEELRDSRLLLCLLTARTIKLGLSLLGIEVADKM